MHIAREATVDVGLDQGLQHDGLPRRAANVAGMRTVPVPATGSPSASTESILLLAWILLLQRERGEDDRVEQVAWGRRGADDREAASPVYLSKLDLGFGSAQSEPVATFLGALAKIPESQAGSSSSDTLFFDDGQASSQKKGSEATLSAQWSFRIEATRNGDDLALQALRRQDSPSSPTDKQAHDRLDTFVDLVRAISIQSETPVAQLLGPLPRDLDQIWKWNAEVPPNLDRCIHEIISEQAASHASKPAVECWDGQFTYAEVESMSDRLARHLCVEGITVGTNIPLCFEKSRWTIVAVLAITKAGGAFALTDPTSQPEARLKVMVEQTGASLVVASQSQADLARRLVPENGKVVVVSDGLFASFDASVDSIPLPFVPATTTPLYIQFTSGSTGKPKGVVISHANYTSGAIPRAEAVGYKESSRVFEFASYAFDVSIDCMLCTLAVGGTICIPSDADRMNDLGGAIKSSGANMAHMTPSVACVLDPEVIAGLDVLGLGGEAISAADAAAWSKGKTSVIIAYGPSECTVGCTVNNTFAQKEGAKIFTTGNIGRGVGGVGWVVDPQDHDRLVPVGAVGELLIEGPVVGLGYLGEPEKTAEVFIEDPAWLTAGHGAVSGRHGRLYKTGDLVRYDADMSGDFVFVGRKDAQVKLRGQRVELVEIEHHLHGMLPRGVKLAAEVIKPIGGQPTLVCFVVDADCSDVESDEGSDSTLGFSGPLAEALEGIDEALAVDLPRYMVPAAYIPLREMPSLVSGKIDRKKLREIGAGMTREQVSGTARRDKQTDASAPETEMERRLQKVWRALLNLTEDFSVQESFFALGGDSLRAMKLISAVRAEGVALTVADVFRYPVLRDMAVVAKDVSAEQDKALSGGIPPFSLPEADWSAEEAKKEVSGLCEIDSAAVEDIYPCTPLQEALMALSAKVKEAYVAQRVLKLDNREKAARLQAAFEAVAADCAILRTRIVHAQRGLMQVVVKEPITWHTAATLAEYLEQDRNEQTDLGKPLVRYGMVHEGEFSHFVLTMHHALYDGWSMPLVVDRVNQAYQQVTLRKPAAEFKDFINYLNNTFDQEASDAYWRGQLDGATGQQFPALPFEGYQTQADSLLEIDISLGGRRLPTSLNATITLATVVRAAWALVASQYCSGNTDIVFGETLTGRNAPIVGADEIEGPMITTVPVRVCIDRDITVEEFLESIAEQMVAQIPYEHAGLQHIRRLTDDALEACELRTGFVLHPAAGEVEVDEKTPANGLVPAGDTEAAQEALKFNTYALMLVCSLSADGFFVMASFDSKTVDKTTMERVLEQLQSVVHQLCDEGAGKMRVGEVGCLVEADEKALSEISGQVAIEGDLGVAADEVESVWVVDAADHQRLVPRGAAGEIVVVTEKHLSAPFVAIETKWFPGGGLLFRTGRLGRIELGENPTLRVLHGSLALPETTKPKISPTPASSAVGASSTKQKTLRAIWSRLLKVDEKSIYLADSFFNRGGDSITAMKLVSEARQQGMQLTVAQVFANRTLYDMANVMQPVPTASTEQTQAVAPVYNPFSAFLFTLKGRIREQLANRSWKVVDVLPTRPLQEVAVRGTVELPRFSIRYELIHFEGVPDKGRLFRACQDVIARNEVLRTVFVRLDGTCFSVVLEDLGTLPLVEYEIEDDDIEPFTNQLCRLDSQTRMPYGSSFVKWFYVTNGRRSTLAFRLSHAQYDEICLPIFLNQLHQLYQDSAAIPPSYPFSSFVNHTLMASIPRAIPYWRNLLDGSKGISLLRPDIPITNRRHYAIHRTVNIASRPRHVTVATLPSAAWALTLARRLKTRDVIFGEVASGRSVDIPGVPDANSIAGPTWQYIPTRVQFDKIATRHGLLTSVQDQHMASSSYDCMGLDEIVRECTDWDASKVEWFDTVVHQDVVHVETLEFKGEKARFETVYPYEEPLREWKCQAFHVGETLTLEIVTFESWKGVAGELLDEVCEALEELVTGHDGEVRL